MFWKLTRQTGPAELDPNLAAGRYVLHRHRDSNGEHLALRLECEDFLIGWRIEGDSLVGEPWATEKAPHALHWIEDAGSLISRGRYAIEESSAVLRTILLETDDGVIRLRFERQDDFTPAALQSLLDSIRSSGTDPAQAARLMADGATARARAIERLCGLGRELDGLDFEAPLWRKSLAGLTLDEIHAQLRAFEARFDKKYPPAPVSRPESLDCNSARSDFALEIARA